MPEDQQSFMEIAIALSIEGMEAGKGGPFGCVVVKDGLIIGKGYNSVQELNDPTAHAEIMAIREACKNLGSFQLESCEIYTSCEPCPMCLGAIYWARPAKVFFANSKADAVGAGFDDSFIYKELNVPLEQRKIPFFHLSNEGARKVFETWVQKEDKIVY